MELLVDASNRTMLVVASSGTGKSLIMRFILSIVKRDKLWLDSVTVPGFKFLAKQLKNAHKSIFIDDLSKGGTEYSQVMTVCALGELVYSGFVKKYSAAVHIEIDGFRGSAIINAQPLILQRVLRAAEFETDIRDKVIRFYHLKQPIKVNLTDPVDGVTYNYNYAEVVVGSGIQMTELWRDTIQLFRLEFKAARSEEHLTALIRASALLNGRMVVEQADIWLVNCLCKCFNVERELFNKFDLEGERQLDRNIIPLLSYLATFHEVPISHIMIDSQIKRSRLYQLLANNKEWVRIVKNSNQQVLIPTPACRQLLKDIGEW